MAKERELQCVPRCHFQQFPELVSHLPKLSFAAPILQHMDGQENMQVHPWNAMRELLLSLFLGSDGEHRYDVRGKWD